MVGKQLEETEESYAMDISSNTRSIKKILREQVERKRKINLKLRKINLKLRKINLKWRKKNTLLQKY